MKLRRRCQCSDQDPHWKFGSHRTRSACAKRIRSWNLQILIYTDSDPKLFKMLLYLLGTVICLRTYKICKEDNGKCKYSTFSAITKPGYGSESAIRPGPETVVVYRTGILHSYNVQNSREQFPIVVVPVTNWIRNQLDWWGFGPAEKHRRLTMKANMSRYRFGLIKKYRIRIRIPKIPSYDAAFQA